MITMGEKVKILENFFNVEKPDDINFEEWADTLENMELGYKKKTGKEISFLAAKGEEISWKE